MKFSFLIKSTLLILVISQFSCRKDFSTLNSNGNLRFSVDTLFLDTVFNNLSTTTKLLKVYNKTDNDVLIPDIKLARNNSKYRINVDGISGTEFNNVLLLKKDSIYIFVEVTYDETPNNNEIVYKDSILFDTNGTQQHVNLITLVQDATFLYSTDQDFELTQTNFTNNKPYVIYGNAQVPSNSSLIIDAGARVYFSKNSSLTIQQGATLAINGTKKDSVVLKSDNLNYQYKEIPGQWQGIHINQAASVQINYANILNATTALNFNESQNTSLKNLQIYNAAQQGISAINTTITGENIVIGQTGQSNLHLQGGSYIFKHCTFANFWNKGIRTTPTLSLTNYYIDENEQEQLIPLQEATFINCIVSGLKNTEVGLNKNSDEPIFNFQFKNCLVNLIKGDDLYDTDNSNLYINVLFNKNLDFRNTLINDLRIGLDNEGINKADANTANEIPLDITETNRTNAPDIGAYQHIDFKTLETEDDQK